MLCGVAAALCNRNKNRTITYSRKVFVPLTTLCRDKCGYCTFVKSPGDPARVLLHRTKSSPLLSPVAGQAAKKRYSALVNAPNSSIHWRVNTCGCRVIQPCWLTCVPCVNWYSQKPVCCRIKTPFTGVYYGCKQRDAHRYAPRTKSQTLKGS